MQSRLIMALLVVLLPASALAWTVPCHHMPVRAAAPPRAFAPSLKASKKAEIKKLENQIAKTEKRIVRAKEKKAEAGKDDEPAPVPDSLGALGFGTTALIVGTTLSDSIQMGLPIVGTLAVAAVAAFVLAGQENAKTSTATKKSTTPKKSAPASKAAPAKKTTEKTRGLWPNPVKEEAKKEATEKAVADISASGESSWWDELKDSKPDPKSLRLVAVVVALVLVGKGLSGGTVSLALGTPLASVRSVVSGIAEPITAFAVPATDLALKLLLTTYTFTRALLAALIAAAGPTSATIISTVQSIVAIIAAALAAAAQVVLPAVSSALGVVFGRLMPPLTAAAAGAASSLSTAVAPATTLASTQLSAIGASFATFGSVIVTEVCKTAPAFDAASSALSNGADKVVSFIKLVDHILVNVALLVAAKLSAAFALILKVVVPLAITTWDAASAFAIATAAWLLPACETAAGVCVSAAGSALSATRRLVITCASAAASAAGPACDAIVKSVGSLRPA